MTWPADRQEWFDCADEIQACADEMLSNLDIRLSENGLEDPMIYAAALLFRTLQSTRAAFELGKKGYVVELNLVARSCVENVLWLRGLQQKGLSFVQEILGDGMRAEAALSELVLNLPDVSLDAEAEAVVQAQLAGRTKIRIELGKISSSPAAGTDYALFRMISNNFAHPSIRSLARHLLQDPATGAFLLDAKPNVDRRELLWALFATAGAAIPAIGLFLDVVPADQRGSLDVQKCNSDLQHLSDRFSALGKNEGFDGDRDARSGGAQTDK